MPLRTTAIELARAKGWSIAELAERSGLSLRALYYLRDGRPPSAQTIETLRALFPECSFEDLFVRSDSTKRAGGGTIAEGTAA